MKLTDMKRSKAEKKAAEKEWASPASPMADDYHHGLRVSLDHDAMQKLGMRDTPKPGDEYHGEFHGRVTRSEHDEDEGGAPRRRVEMVMHHIGMEPKKDGKSLRDDVAEAAAKHEKK